MFSCEICKTFKNIYFEENMRTAAHEDYKHLYLKLDSYLSKKLFYFLQWKPFKSDEKCFYFTLKALFVTPQKMKFSIKDFFSKCDQICRKLRIWSLYWINRLWKTSFYLQCLSWLSGYVKKRLDWEDKVNLWRHNPVKNN